MLNYDTEITRMLGNIQKNTQNKENNLQNAVKLVMDTPRPPGLKKAPLCVHLTGI